MAGAFTGPAGYAPPCPCSTVRRLRLSEYRRSNFSSSSNLTRVRAAMEEGGKKKKRAEGSEDEGNRMSRRRSMLGFVALASPALLMSSSAQADVKEKPLNESQLARMEMLQAVEKRVSSMGLEDAVAPPLKNKDSSVEGTRKDDSAVPQSDARIMEAAIVDEPKASENASSGGFLNRFGVLGSGVFGALYWFEGRAKSASKAALEEANKKLEKAQAAMASLKETMEKNMMDQREQAIKQLTDSEKDRIALANELSNLRSEARELQLQLESQKNVAQTLEKKVKSYQASMKDAEDKARKMEDRLMREEQRRQVLENEVKGAGILVKEKEMRIASVETELREQEGRGAELQSELCSTKSALVEAEDRILDLGRELVIARSCLDEREDAMQDLKKSLATALSKVDEAQEELTSVRQEMSELQQSTSQSLANANAALSSKEEEVQGLLTRLDIASSESREAFITVEMLQQEIKKLEDSLSQEQAVVKNLSADLKSAMGHLETKTNEASSLYEDLKSSREETEQIKLQKREMEAANEAKVTSLRETLQAEQVLSSQMQHELDETRTAFQASSLEVKSLSEKLQEVMSANKKIQSELEEVRQTADSTMVTLNDEKRKVAAAEKQFIETQKALAREEMLVESLRSEFAKAMEAMNDLRRHLGSLSKDLQEANVKITSLENERSSLLESLAKEKKSAKILKDKAASAESELTKLTREKEGSMFKASKLEDELNAAEAEMLKLKEQMLLMGNVIDSAETRMGSIAQVNREASSLVKSFEKLTTKAEQKEGLKHQIDRLKEQSKAATEISRELRNMKQLLSHFQQNLDEAELDRVEAEAALHAAVNAKDEPQRVMAPTYSSDGTA